MDLGPEYPITTIGTVFNNTTQLFPGNEAIVFNEDRIDYATFRRKVDILAKSLIKIGIKKGDKVGVLISNRPEVLYSQYAIAKIGAICVFINTRYKTYEISHILREADITAFILMDRFLNIDYWDMLTDILPEIATSNPGKLESADFPFLTTVVILNSKGAYYPGTYNFSEIFQLPDHTVLDDELKRRELSVKPNDIAMILFTSGTTGLPKGAMLTHRNILWNNANAYPIKSDYSSADRHIVPNPIATTGGSTSISVTNVSTAATSILVERFDPQQVLKLVSTEKVTVLHGVPAMYQMYLEEASATDHNLSSLRIAVTAGDYCPPSLAERIKTELTDNFIIGYGQTETCAFMTQTSLNDPYEKQITTVGKPYEGVDVKICAPHNSNELSSGDIGEICVRGPIVMLGYYNRTSETQKAIDGNNWLHTGDLGSLDNEGFLTIKGRLKELLISGGYNIYPVEVENLLQSHPKIKVAKVVPIPDKKLREVVGAILELKDDAYCSEQEIVDFCKKRIANYKVPRYFKFVKEWPLVAIGKFDKQSIKKSWVDELTSKDLL
jgi:fatty-acyl-CoA synthase